MQQNPPDPVAAAPAAAAAPAPAPEPRLLRQHQKQSRSGAGTDRRHIDKCWLDCCGGANAGSGASIAAESKALPINRREKEKLICAVCRVARQQFSCGLLAPAPQSLQHTMQLQDFRWCLNSCSGGVQGRGQPQLMWQWPPGCLNRCRVHLVCQQYIFVNCWPSAVVADAAARLLVR